MNSLFHHPRFICIFSIVHGIDNAGKKKKYWNLQKTSETPSLQSTLSRRRGICSSALHLSLSLSEPTRAPDIVSACCGGERGSVSQEEERGNASAPLRGIGECAWRGRQGEEKELSSNPESRAAAAAAGKHRCNFAALAIRRYASRISKR